MNIVMLISKSFVFKMFFVYTKTESRRFEVGGLKSVFEKLRFRDGLAWTVGITVK